MTETRTKAGTTARRARRGSSGTTSGNSCRHSGANNTKATHVPLARCAALPGSFPHLPTGGQHRHQVQSTRTPAHRSTSQRPASIWSRPTQRLTNQSDCEPTLTCGFVGVNPEGSGGHSVHPDCRERATTLGDWTDQPRRGGTARRLPADCQVPASPPTNQPCRHSASLRFKPRAP